MTTTNKQTSKLPEYEKVRRKVYWAGVAFWVGYLCFVVAAIILLFYIL